MLVASVVVLVEDLTDVEVGGMEYLYHFTLSFS